ncbi:MAG TPA: carboxypeptidase regulatory-like domain-containing protein [Chitinophagaceae bacterium]|nr:carboxypeptidase regulatory-like domain-containing protein [Chitinophagaceae bacterium]
MRLLKIMSLLLITVFSGTSLFAQVTTSNISGVVLSDKKEPLIGATVVATHEPTGSVYRTQTVSRGIFTISNVAPGGPYKIEVTYSGFSPQKQENIFLNLGEVFRIEINMVPASVTLTEVVITGTRQRQGAKGGVETNIGRDRLVNLPTVGRQLTDFIRLTPQARVTYGGGISIAGQNNRYNQLTIDGAVNNDVFGLSETGANGGQTGSPPISIDAIDAFQVGVSPYDVALGNFTGGSINANTKSGTNKITGSAYYIFRNENLAGKTPTGEKSVAKRVPDFSAKTFGATLGGPIIKNKAFYFLSFERQDDERPQPFDPSTFRVASFRDSVSSILTKLNSYGYDPGSWENIPDLVTSNKVAAKFTFNLSNVHKLNASYRYTGSERSLTSPSSTTTIRFFNGGYLFPSTTHSGSLELLSNFSRRISNKALLTYTHVLDDRDALGKDFPRVTLNSVNGTSYIFGTEEFSTANQLKQDNIAFFDEFKLSLGKGHQIKAGVDLEYSKSYNLFIRQNYGAYTYSSVLAWLTDAKPATYNRSFSLVDSKTGDGSSAAAKFNTLRLGFFLADQWDITNDFQLNYGVRVDNFEFLTTPNLDTFFNKYAVPQISLFYDLNGARSGLRPQAQLSVSPRVGFTYNIKEEKLKIRGGIGFFTGRIPLVWPGGAYNNTGVNVGGISLNSSAINALPSFTFRADPFNQYQPQDVGQTFTPPSGQIDLIDPKFKLPKVLKTSLGFDKELGNRWNLQIDLLYQKNINEVDYKNFFGVRGLTNVLGQTTFLTNSTTYNRIDLNGTVAGTQNPYSTGIFLITNAKGKKGFSYNFSVAIDKSFSNGWALNASYSYGDSYSIFDGTSSQNNSNWRFIETSTGRSNLELSRSDFAQLHRINAYVSKKFAYFKDRLATTVTLFYNGQSGSPYSYTYTRSLIFDNNGVNNETQDLIYVPQNLLDWQRVAVPYTSGGVTYSVADQWRLLDAYIENDRYLKTRRGKFAERNGAVLPFSHIVDARIQQDFNIKIRGVNNKFSVILDIFNFTNLLNRTWGRIYRTPGVDQYQLITVENTNYSSTLVNGQLKPNITYRNINNLKANDILDLRSDAYNATRWRGQITIRYTFQ